MNHTESDSAESNEPSNDGSCTPSDIPTSVKCSLCSCLCRKAMRLVCNKSPACWGCAVKEITSTHTCWQCGEINISSGKHLFRDENLRSEVEKFTMKLKKCKANNNGLLSGVNGLLNNNSTSSLNLKCFAKSKVDGLWSNGIITQTCENKSYMVYFQNYGNSEVVPKNSIVRKIDCIPSGEVSDKYISEEKKALSHAATVDFMSFAETSLKCSFYLELICKSTITGLKEPEGLGVLADDTILIACTGTNNVLRYSRNGVFLEELVPGRSLVKPTELLILSNGEFVVGDTRGIQLFDCHCKFVKHIGEDIVNCCYGLSEDDEGNIVTINRDIKNNVPFDTIIYFIDVVSGQVVKKYELEDLITDAAESLQLSKELSLCKHLEFRNSKLHVVDFGLDCIFVLDQSGTESHMFGKRGDKEGEFRDPSGIVVDDLGTMLVTDSRNSRVQVVSNDLEYMGMATIQVCN